MDSLPTSSLDTPQLSLWSGNTSNVKFLDRERMKGGSRNLKSMKEMYGYSTGVCTPEKWIASMRGSLVRIYPLLASGLEWEKAHEAAFFDSP